MTLADPAIDTLDRKLLHLLLKDACTPSLESVRKRNVSGATERLRTRGFKKAGLIQRARLTVAPSKPGIGIRAHVRIHLVRGFHLHEVVEKLKSVLEILECHATPGIYPIVTEIHCREASHPRKILDAKIQALPMVLRTETWISLDHSSERQTILDAGE
jgi:Lrp/AsnC family transcriptional regulator, regulator for asnA, asnC and gidA